MHFLTNGYKLFSKTNSTDPRQCVPLSTTCAVFIIHRHKLNTKLNFKTHHLKLEEIEVCETFDTWASMGLSKFTSRLSLVGRSSQLNWSRILFTFMGFFVLLSTSNVICSSLFKGIVQLQICYAQAIYLGIFVTGLLYVDVAKLSTHNHF